MFRDGTSQIACACIEAIRCTGDATPVQPPDRIVHSEATRSCRAGQEFVTCYDGASWPMQVLNIVYGGSAAKPSAFYPKGVNGNINGTGSG